jgi:hypothetical protein
VTIRKVISPTQPGRGIRKVIDLFHDLPELLAKADKHVVSQRLTPTEREKIDRADFVDMTEEDIEDERQEYVHGSRYISVCCDST